MSIEQFVLAYNTLGDYMKFQRIRDLREDADLTQSEMGKAINLPQRTYAYYESGKRTVPPEVLISLAKYHKTTTDYILGLTDKR
jgi:transcriptional regulator with XRE-family HTH domain